MKSKLNFKKLRLSYKIAIVSIVISVICTMLVFSSLFSIYSLVGEQSIDGEQSAAADKELKDIEKRNNILNGIIILSTVSSILTASYGAYQDVRSKPKR